MVGEGLAAGVLERAEMVFLDAYVREAHVEAHGVLDVGHGRAQVVPVGVVVDDAAENIVDLGKRELDVPFT